MSLTAGSRVGSFIIQARIGTGGMGEVYLAEDARLRRRVALKVIAPDLVMDAAAGKRLLREARAAATLEHPNICTVYEVGEADGRGFIAMQYVDGASLADRLKQAPLELPAAISIGAQVANALTEAHQHGIVHRDIKPQNVMLSAANHATVLDFGLAKAAGPAGAASQTASVLTEAGVVSGTLSYMSPEQARAEVVDERSDVFSFGILLYELVSRLHPFVRDSWADTLAAILTRDPRPIPIAIPSELRRILRKCLEKDRTRRYQTMRDVAIDLENLAQELSGASTEGVPPATAPAPVRRRTHRTAWIGTAVIVTLGAAAAAIVWWKPEKPAPVQSGYEAITDFTDSATAPALSPDGRMVTFIRGGPWFLTTAGQIYVKMLPNGEAVRLTDDPRPKTGPVFSADGSRVAYTTLAPGADGMSWDTWTVPISGGTPSRLLANAAGLSWIDPRHVLFSEVRPGTTLHMGLVTATEDRRDARHIYLPAHERAMAHFSYLSPDRAWLLVVEMGPMGTFDRCRLLPFDGSSSGRQVGPTGSCHAAAWSPDQRWMYFTAEVDGPSHLWRQRFPDGAPEPLTSSGVAEEEGVAFAPDGQSLVTSIGIRQSSLWLHSENGERLLSSEGYASHPRISTDGKRLYYLQRRAAAQGVVELRVMDLATLKSDRVLPDFSVVDFAVSRDEQQVAVTTRAADRSLEIWVAALDRRTAPRRVVQAGDQVAFGADHDLLFRSIEGHVNFVTRISLDGKNRVRLADVNAIEVMGTSPDGQWVTFAGTFDSRRFGVMVLPVHGGEPKVLCYERCKPEWSPDAASLYLATGPDSPSRILVVPLQPGRAFPDFPAGTTDALTAWRKLPTARVIERPASIPGLEESTYVTTKTDERRNLFRVPLSR
jgi:Tol biopolymer transport system component/tRNA A-37 threonylcarbamoyl transferase component Bud32